MSDHYTRPKLATPGRGDVARDETASLISSDKIAGTSVYDHAGTMLGSIHSMMIGKQDGRVGYAVLSFGGFLGLGQSYFPIPWSQLSYSHDHDGYVTSVTERQLTDAPKYDTTEADSWSQGGWRDAVDAYYRPPTV